MHKYYDTITTATNLSRKTGTALVVSNEFQILSSKALSGCVFIQNLIQQIIYTSHGAELTKATKTLKEFPNPKARVEFLCNFPYSSPDIFIERVFDYARTLFRGIYDIRNVLAHEVWSSSNEYPGLVLFSMLDEESKLLLASGQLWHKEDTTPKDIYDATIRYIRNTKVVSCKHLSMAVRDIDICSWSLMNITHFLDEKDEARKSELREAFLVFNGTSHLFADIPAKLKTVEVSSSRGKTIN